jgi:hypothetical protein
MIRLIGAFLAGAMLCLIGNPTFARGSKAFDWGPSSLRLSEDMTEQQAINAVGYSPNKAELSTCGTESARGPWKCRVLTFGESYNNLTVFERDDGDDTIGRLWVVNHWVLVP